MTRLDSTFTISGVIVGGLTARPVDAADRCTRCNGQVHVSRRGQSLVAICVLAVLVGGWAFVRHHADERPTATTSQASESTCPMSTLPREVVDTVHRIHAGGPYPFPHSDGEVFGNHEGHLPRQQRGYYHEYTVITPHARDRSMRRIVTGGVPLAHPGQYFYTGNHYDSFCLVIDAGSQP